MTLPIATIYGCPACRVPFGEPCTRACVEGDTEYERDERLDYRDLEPDTIDSASSALAGRG